MSDRDPRDVPIYSVADASRWARVASSTLRSWVAGRSYRTEVGESYSERLIKPAQRQPVRLSFNNLVEVFFLGSLRRGHHLRMAAVRAALEYVETKQGIARPLLHQEFQTDGVDLFVDEYRGLTNVSRRGQGAMKAILAACLRRVDRDVHGMAMALYPFTRFSGLSDEPRRIVIDPRISFGRPVVSGTGIRTEMVAMRWRAGETVEHLARDYGVEPEEIEEALRLEARAVA